MAESEGIKEAVNQVAIQVATAVMMALRYAKARPQLTIVVSIESQRQKHSRLVLVKPAFNQGTQNRYVELMNFETEVSNILEPKYMILLGRKGPSVQKLVGLGESAANTNIHSEIIREMQHSEGSFCSVVQ